MSLVVIPVEELKEIVRWAVKEELGKMEIAKELAVEKEEPLPPILRVAELQKYLGIPRSTVYQLTHYKKIPFMKKGGTLFFSKDEVDKWIASGRQQTIYNEREDREKRIASLGARIRQKAAESI